jgi:hypothetical protein
MAETANLVENGFDLSVVLNGSGRCSSRGAVEAKDLDLDRKQPRKIRKSRLVPIEFEPHCRPMATSYTFEELAAIFIASED